MIENFDGFSLKSELEKAIAEKGFVKPTPIQAQVIPLILSGNDCLAQAPTGTGKTCAFGIPFLNKIDTQEKNVQALVLCPTRELAMQIENELKDLAKSLPSVKVLAIYGGQNIERQLAGLRKKPQFVVGTPGRIMDHLRRKTLRIDQLTMLALDEADEMLNMGFREDIDTILSSCVSKHQTVLFSATMSNDIMNISKSYQNDPCNVKIQLENIDIPDIKQYALQMKSKEKDAALAKIMMDKDYGLAIVFCNTKKKADELSEFLIGKGFLAESLHGDMRQRNRDNVMKRYRGGDINILVATDVAARGIDVEGIEAVFNYDIPKDNEYYIHRIGRTARANRTGEAYSFFTEKDSHKKRELEKFTKTKMIDYCELGEDMGNFTIDERIEKAFKEADANLEPYYKAITESIEKYNDSHKKCCSFLDFSAWLLKSIDSQNAPTQAKKDSFVKQKSTRANSTRYFFNIGKKDGLDEAGMRLFLSQNTTVTNDKIVDISVLDTFSFASIENGFDDDVLSLSNTKYNTRILNVEVAGNERKPKSESNGGKFFKVRNNSSSDGFRSDSRPSRREGFSGGDGFKSGSRPNRKEGFSSSGEGYKFGSRNKSESSGSNGDGFKSGSRPNRSESFGSNGDGFKSGSKSNGKEGFGGKDRYESKNSGGKSFGKSKDVKSSSDSSKKGDTHSFKGKKFSPRGGKTF